MEENYSCWIIVLNLIITGIPSIPFIEFLKANKNKKISFKPYYNWNTFNTAIAEQDDEGNAVLNLIITGIPSILNTVSSTSFFILMSFKPYYNWNTFNTLAKIPIWYLNQKCFKPYYNWNTFNTENHYICK